MQSREEELRAREEALNAREEALKRREEALKDKPFSRAVQRKKEAWYDRINVSVRTMDVIIWVTAALLAIVVVLIALEAAGIFTLRLR